MVVLTYAPARSYAFFVRAALLLGVASFSACKVNETARASKPENAQTWSPAKLASVEGVPATEIEAQMKTKLAGAKPAKIDDDQWTHTKAVYKAWGDNPLWLSSNGLHEGRTKAITDAILLANTDGMRMDDYPDGFLLEDEARR